MKRYLAVSLLLLIPIAVLGSGRVGHRPGSGHNTSISTDSREVDSCSDIQVRYDNREAVRAEEVVAVAPVPLLKVSAGQNGGVHVRGWDGSGYSITACKAAALASTLADIRVSVEGNSVTSSGSLVDPDWTVFFLVKAPRSAALNLQASNGAIGIRDIRGSVTARSENGPVGIRDSTGTLDVEVTNGPIELVGSAGSARLRAQNGPITVALDGDHWQGRLDASSENGPLMLKLPAGYRSGVTIETDGRSPVSCRVAGCQSSSTVANRIGSDDDTDDDLDSLRVIHLGSGPEAVHLQTVNGPVSVKER